VDADHFPVHISQVRGGVYLVEDTNYWKTNSVFYVAPGGVLFINGGWSSKSAAQILWKAATLSYQEFIGVIPVSGGLHHTGGLWEFRKQRVPILLTKEVSREISSNWKAWNEKMRGFGSWKIQDAPQADEYLALETNGRVEMLGGKVVIIFPGPTSSPDALAVYFPQEKILYAGDMLADPPHFMQPQSGARQNIETLQSLDFDTIINGHGQPVKPRTFFTFARDRSYR
jgi:metallo-beta-lactamase class B